MGENLAKISKKGMPSMLSKYITIPYKTQGLLQRHLWNKKTFISPLEVTVATS